MFTAQIVHVFELFANLIQVPSFQRAFAWTPKEAGQLLDDISLALDEADADGDYFLGTMLFIDRDGAAAAPSRLSWRARPSRTLEVIDGFQRLTTLTILLCALRDLDGGADRPANTRLLGAIQVAQGGNARPRLALGEREDKFFLDHVRAPGATRLQASADVLTPAGERIVEVRDHILAALSALDAAERRRLADFLLDRCCVVLVATTGIDRAHRMFTVLNTAGKSLARNDILKAVLLGSVRPPDDARCLAIWTEAETRLGEEFESLFSHVRAMYGRPGSQVIAGVIEIAKSRGAQAFIEGVLQPAAGIMDDINNARHSGTAHSATISQYLRYLGWHSFADWKPLALTWWLRNGQDAAALERFLAKLDRLAFGIRILGIGGSKRSRRFGAVIDAIEAGRDVMGSESPLQLTRAELRTIQHNLRDMHGRHATTAKLLLLRLTDAKAGMPQSLSLPGNMTVEHVLPKKLSARSHWRNWHPDPEDRERCTDSLGNLVIVTKDQNDKAGNHDFARKLQVYFNTRGAPAVALNEDLRGRTEWKAREIRAREAELFQLIEELWQFGLAPPRAQAAE
jgi:Protein of unknown function DUF262/Protein of unknown function (DUF1524)